MAVNGASYYQCGSTWYQPQYAGSDVQYVVVNAPQSRYVRDKQKTRER